MKKYILWLISIIWLWIINFSSAWSYTYTWFHYYWLSSSSSTSDSTVTFFVLPFPLINSNMSSSIMSQLSNISCDFTNIDYGSLENVRFSSQVSFQYLSWTSNWRITSYSPWDYTINWNTASFNSSISFSSNWFLRYYYVYLVYKRPNSATAITFDYSCTFSWNNIIDQSSIGGWNCDYSDYILESDVTKSYCTNKFSTLIDESDITSWYCETEFGLIDPENCPVSSWTGDVQWSAFFVNSHQIQGASNIYLYLPDFLNWDYTYLNSWSSLEIEVENQWDEDYIKWLISVETFHPSSEDFTQSFTWILTLLMPYIIITLFILFIWRLVKRIFK